MITWNSSAGNVGHHDEDSEYETSRTYSLETRRRFSRGPRGGAFVCSLGLNTRYGRTNGESDKDFAGLAGTCEITMPSGGHQSQAKDPLYQLGRSSLHSG